MSPVRYPNLFRAPIRISISCDHNPKLFSFRMMFAVNAELSGGATICGDGFEVSGLIGFISISVGFSFFRDVSGLIWEWFECLEISGDLW